MAKKSNQGKGGGSPPRDVLYSEVAVHTPKAIDIVVELMSCKNENVRLGAAKTILSKSIPDLRATEITGKHGRDLYPITIFTGLNTTRKGFIPPSRRSITNGQPQVQGTGVAQKSKKDINSDKRDSKASAP